MLSLTCVKHFVFFFVDVLVKESDSTFESTYVLFIVTKPLYINKKSPVRETREDKRKKPDINI